MACIVHHMWLHVMQYAHCTQIISSLITHIVLYEGLKQRKQTWNASCMYGIEENFSVFLLFPKNSTRQCVCKPKGVYLLSAPLCAQCRKFCMWNQWICNVCDWFSNRHKAAWKGIFYWKPCPIFGYVNWNHLALSVDLLCAAD